MSTITEIAPDVFRFSTFTADFGIQFNQFLVRDDEPFLMHTGPRMLFPVTRDLIAKVVDPAKLRWIGYSHFEPDECGALNELLAIAPHAQAVAGFVGANVMLGDFSNRPPRTLADDEVIETGRHRIRYLSTPHLPHGWDASLFFDERNRTLFSSDLFFTPGDPAPTVESSVAAPSLEASAASLAGPMAHDMPYTPRTAAMFDRLEALAPRTIAVMHGSSFRGDGAAEVRTLAAGLKKLLG